MVSDDSLEVIQCGTGPDVEGPQLGRGSCNESQCAAVVKAVRPWRVPTSQSVERDPSEVREGLDGTVDQSVV